MKLIFQFIKPGLNLQLQYFLINEYLLQDFIYHEESWIISEERLEDIKYEKEIRKVLCNCIRHHIFLKRCINYLKIFF